MAGPKKTERTDNHDLFRPRLDSFIDKSHELVVLADKMDRDEIHDVVASMYTSPKGRASLPARFLTGLTMLKAIYKFSDEEVCRAWTQNPYFQYFTGEEFFQHKFPHDRSNLTHFRQRIGDALEAILVESLRVAFTLGAIGAQELAHVTVDTTVMEKNVAHPSDAKLMVRAIKGVRDACYSHGIKMPHSYVKVCRRAAIKAGRYAHAHQFKRMRKQLRSIPNCLGRVIRFGRRQIGGNETLNAAMDPVLDRARQVRREYDPKRGSKACWRIVNKIS